MKTNTNSESSASAINSDSENIFENVKKFSDVFELKTDIDFDVYFEETDDVLPSLVWCPDFKLTDTCREVYAEALDCPVRIDDSRLFIDAAESEINSAYELVIELLTVLSGYCSSSIYDRMVMTE